MRREARTIMNMNINFSLSPDIPDPVHAFGKENSMPVNSKPVINLAGSGIAGESPISPIEQKKQAARKQAMKLVSDAFEGELKADGMMDSQRERFRELQKQRADLKKEIANMEEKGLPEVATEEERNAYHEALKEYRKQVFDAESEMLAIDQSLRSTKIERLKTNPIRDAFDQTENIMEAAREDIIGTITSDAMEHIDEEQEKEKEKAEKIKEEKEEFEERIEKNKEKKAEQEELTEALMESADNVNSGKMSVEDAQEEVKKMLAKLGLLEDEIKGAVVDEVAE